MCIPQILLIQSILWLDSEVHDYLHIPSRLFDYCNAYRILYNMVGKEVWIKMILCDN